MAKRKDEVILDDNKPEAPPQRYKQCRKERRETYDAARALYDSWTNVPEERKRLRARPAGHFDVIEYELI